MKTELKQRAFFEKREFKITEEGLETYVKDHETDSTNFWHFDNIELKNRYYTEKRPKILYWALIIMVIGLVRTCFFFGDDLTRSLISGISTFIIGTGVLGFYFLNQKKYFLIELDNEKQIFVLAQKPNETEFNAFIETLYQKRAEYYKKNYFFIDYTGEKEKQLSKMKWLKKENIISDKEYEFVIEEINEKLN